MKKVIGVSVKQNIPDNAVYLWSGEFNSRFTGNLIIHYFLVDADFEQPK